MKAMLERITLLCAVLLIALPALGYGQSTENAGPPQPDNPDLLDTLHRNQVITDAQYAQLKKQQEERQEREALREKATAAHLDLLPDRIYGFIQFDAPLSVDDGQALGTRSLLRRFYLFFRKEVAPDWSYATAFGYSNGSPYFDYGYVTYHGLRVAGLPLAISGGYYKVPGTLAYPVSPKDLTFMEYALPVDALKPSKSVGLKVATHGTRWSLAMAGTQGGYTQKAEPGVEGRWGVSLRGTLVPWLAQDGLWEIGTSLAWREADSNHKAEFSDRPEAYVVGTKLVDTGIIHNVSWYSLAGSETLLQTGPFELQAEYLLKQVNRDGAPHLTFPGWYAQATWSLTGESRPYDIAEGKLGGITPRHPLGSGGWGAWQLAARYSALDLTNNDVHGGLERNITLGVNWFPIKWVKLMLNAIRVLPVDGGPHPNQSTTIMMLRMQGMF